MKENRTLDILKRASLVVGIVVVVIVLARVNFAITSLSKTSYLNWYLSNEEPVGFWNYFITYSDEPGVIAFSLLGGAIHTFLVGLAIAFIYLIYYFILYGFKPKPDEVVPICTNRGCTCISHQSEVFGDNSWDAQECKNPNCTCVDYHWGEVFNHQTQRWE